MSWREDGHPTSGRSITAGADYLSNLGAQRHHGATAPAYYAEVIRHEAETAGISRWQVVSDQPAAGARSAPLMRLAAGHRAVNGAVVGRLVAPGRARVGARVRDREQLVLLVGRLRSREARRHTRGSAPPLVRRNHDAGTPAVPGQLGSPREATPRRLSPPELAGPCLMAERRTIGRTWARVLDLGRWIEGSASLRSYGVRILFGAAPDGAGVSAPTAGWHYPDRLAEDEPRGAEGMRSKRRTAWHPASGTSHLCHDFRDTDWAPSRRPDPHLAC